MKVAIVDAFIDGTDGGNSAGVVIDTHNMPKAQKQYIAQTVGLSETAFIAQSKTADFKIEFFTPIRQIAHCGHATVAATSYLAQQGLLNGNKASIETIEGKLDVEIDRHFAYMTQRAPTYVDVKIELSEIYQSIGLDKAQVIGKPKIANTGNAFLLIGVDTIKTLEELTINFDAITKISNLYDLIGFYVFTLETNIRLRDASARMFAPRYGINEESATGMAAGPLACYLRDHLQISKQNFHVEQGYSMNPKSPSCIKVELIIQNEQIERLKAGGIGKLARYEVIDTAPLGH